MLNVSPTAVRDLLMDAEMVSFVARFGGVSQGVNVPMDAVQAIYARENGRGMMFPDEDEFAGESSEDEGSEDEGNNKTQNAERRKGPNLRVVK